MEKRVVAPATTTAPMSAAEGYMGWEEVFVCSEKGRREIHYYLKRKDGGSDLAIIGKEKSLRHMSYRFLLHLNSFPFHIKLRSRREVVDWLNSVVPGSPAPVSPQISGCFSDGNEAAEFDVKTVKDTQLRKLGHYTKDFLWLGSPWTCKKRRNHYQAFRRNGFKISVNEFVYVMAEEDKRLVAYLDDMYEDAKGNKMVVVRWFHKIDELGIDLPRNYNDREIFFSLCLQDLNIECIDGLATVLSPDHYVKFLNKAKHTQLQPFVCHRQYDNDDVKPLDITQVKGYWKQEILRYMFSLSSSKVSEKSCLPDDTRKKGDVSDFCGTNPRKRLRLSRDCKVDVQHPTLMDMVDTNSNANHQGNMICLVQQKNDAGKSVIVRGPIAPESRKDTNVEMVPQSTAVGSLVEVLSQDSGMRGCWLRATIIKKHENKVKLRYHDIKDAENEADCLEEWVWESRVAIRDEMGIRIYGRTTIRPCRPTDNGKVSSVMNVGTVVDAWWHDGWWEGIVIQKEADEELRVYFPGEKQETVFCQSDLRRSREWLKSSWKDFDGRPDLAASILSNLVKARKTCDNKLSRVLVCKDEHLEHDIGKHSLCLSHTEFEYKKANSASVLDLSKDDFLSRLKWKTSRKRRRNALCVQKLQHSGCRRIRPRGPHGHLLIPSALEFDRDNCKSVKVDHDNCKYISDSLFSSSVVPPLTNLVMSR